MKEPLVVPAFAAYIEPDPEGAAVRVPVGVTGWTDRRQSLNWFGYLPAGGALKASVRLRLPEREKSVVVLTLTPVSPTARPPIARVPAEVHGAVDAPGKTDFGAVSIPQGGYYRIRLEGVSKSSAAFGDVESLVLDGPAANGAHFNLKERRNAASVHLGYPVPPDARIVGFYNEVTVRTDPVWSYYMACGFRRGYFGIQVNSPTERRIIFSVWDSGNEAVDRNKVASSDRVRLLEKGNGVVASDFGNEGTGGHSHLVYRWKTDMTYRFFVTARPDGDATIYAGHFWFPERRAWGLIARFRAPKDGKTLSGLYSFNENFGGANGELRRLAEFGNPCILTADGAWEHLRRARFTHDATGKKDRKDYAAGVVEIRFPLSDGEDRKDYAANVRESRFYLSNGGFVVGDKPVRLGDIFTLPAVIGQPPKDLPRVI